MFLLPNAVTPEINHSFKVLSPPVSAEDISCCVSLACRKKKKEKQINSVFALIERSGKVIQPLNCHYRLSGKAVKR